MKKIEGVAWIERDGKIDSRSEAGYSIYPSSYNTEFHSKTARMCGLTQVPCNIIVGQKDIDELNAALAYWEQRKDREKL